MDYHPVFYRKMKELQMWFGVIILYFELFE